MSALVRMRVAGFARTGRSLAPLLAGLVVIGILYGGGQARPAEAYGVSAVVLFPVLAWQTKLLLDTEPDVQRHLARVIDRREWLAGLAAAALAGLVPVALALVLPWLIGGVKLGQGDSLPGALAVGLWTHGLALPAAVALGALASRAVTRSAGYGVAVLVSGMTWALVLGLKSSPAPWLAPPVMPVARAVTGAVQGGQVAVLSVWGAGWAVAGLACYAYLRRTRP
ncbi:hypothetical protein [Rhizomonospora bruguierae]|uniref:hypothetical protein n=1 Tax=Rhizomonospora bruguierae TaxID=1581705 RepID=UPI001BCC3B7C|nr:hypothetical protein [Micromonospora sp. NBRC 107566]